MKISKRNRLITLISLMLFPMLIIFCSVSLNAQAGPPIPEQNPNNGWYWGIGEKDQIYFEGEFIVTNVSTGEVSMMWKDLWIYNITSIENVTIDWLGTHEFSQVNATQCYYNVTDGVNELEAYSESSEIALFGYNSTDAITHRIRAGMSGMPFLLPINGSSLNVDILAPIILQTFYDPFGQMGIFNNFTDYSSDFVSRRIQFSHVSDPYYTDGTYFNNGTLDYGEVYLWVNMEGDPIYVNATIKQVFDYDITDEVEWGVDIGEEIYYTSYDGSYDIAGANEMLLNITGFSDVLLEKTNNSLGDSDPIYMVYEAVYADRFFWNGTDYVFQDNRIIGAANNFYPQYYDEIEEKNPILPILWPINVPLEDYEFMWNLDTLRIWEKMNYDEIYITENGLLEFELNNSTGIDNIKIIIDKATGITKSYIMINLDGIKYFEIRSQTLVEWSVSPGDVLYYKNNEEGLWDVRANILGTLTLYANMSYFFDPLGLTLPSDQPEHQFFSWVHAEVYEWDADIDLWIHDNEGPIAIANIYWPISPLQFEYGPPLLMPEGTTSSELTDLFDMFDNLYDDITYNPGHILLRNTTLSRELNFHFDETSGRVTMMNGWTADIMTGGSWRYMSIYPKFYQTLNPGSNHFSLNTDFPSGITVSMDVEIGGTGAAAALLYNYFTMNPVNIPLPEGTPLAYFDQLFIGRSLVAGNITMTITLPTTIDVNNVVLFFYAFNMSGTEDWEGAPPEFYIDSVTFDGATNSVILNFEAWEGGVISAMSYMTIEEVLEEIPGYNVFLLSLMIIIVSGLVIRKGYRKK
ncbi:MAG: hypothetical protein ACFFG0_16530 [Candidatus Thorarchaeota archaeon]